MLHCWQSPRTRWFPFVVCGVLGCRLSPATRESVIVTPQAKTGKPYVRAEAWVWNMTVRRHLRLPALVLKDAREPRRPREKARWAGARPAGSRRRPYLQGCAHLVHVNNLLAQTCSSMAGELRVCVNPYHQVLSPAPTMEEQPAIRNAATLWAKLRCLGWFFRSHNPYRAYERGHCDDIPAHGHRPRRTLPCDLRPPCASWFPSPAARTGARYGP